MEERQSKAPLPGTQLRITERPGETPATQLRRTRQENPAFAKHLNYTPHTGKKQRERYLRQEARRLGTDVVTCYICGRSWLLPAMDDDGTCPDCIKRVAKERGE